MMDDRLFETKFKRIGDFTGINDHVTIACNDCGNRREPSYRCIMQSDYKSCPDCKN